MNFMMYKIINNLNEKEDIISIAKESFETDEILFSEIEKLIDNNEIDLKLEKRKKKVSFFSKNH